MATFKVEAKGLEEVGRLMRRYGEAAADQLDDDLRRAAVDTRSNAVRSIQRGPATGRIYPPVTGRRGQPHQASAPGQAPATDTGRLVGSIAFEKTRGGWAAGTSLDYGKHLELGTLHMAARPWLVPAANEAAETLRTRVLEGLRRLRVRR